MRNAATVLATLLLLPALAAGQPNPYDAQAQMALAAAVAQQAPAYPPRPVAVPGRFGGVSAAGAPYVTETSHWSQPWQGAGPPPAEVHAPPGQKFIHGFPVIESGQVQQMANFTHAGPGATASGPSVCECSVGGPCVCGPNCQCGPGPATGYPQAMPYQPRVAYQPSPPVAYSYLPPPQAVSYGYASMPAVRYGQPSMSGCAGGSCGTPPPSGWSGYAVPGVRYGAPGMSFGPAGGSPMRGGCAGGQCGAGR